MTAETAILEARIRQELQQLDKIADEMKKALKPSGMGAHGTTGKSIARCITQVDRSHK